MLASFKVAELISQDNPDKVRSICLENVAVSMHPFTPIEPSYAYSGDCLRTVLLSNGNLPVIGFQGSGGENKLHVEPLKSRQSEEKDERP